MIDKQRKYIRWQSWDYSQNAAYFITICTRNRLYYFGQIIDGQMNPTPIGQSAYDCWLAIPEHFPFVKLGAFVVMPNHLHGIIIIDKPVRAETEKVVSKQNELSWQPNKFGRQSENLAAIVRGYKIGITKFAQQNDLSFGWQPRYHDHVIRNEEEYAKIHHYIEMNPQLWDKDTYHGEESHQA